jgi:hypothetical protein
MLTVLALSFALRLTETSITEIGKVDGEHYAMKTKGYGLGYIDSLGFGGHLTSLSSTGHGASYTSGATNIDLRHVYLDASYTHGFFDEHALITGGFGVGVAGKARYTDAAGGHSTTAFGSKDYFIGPGFSVGWFEAYWIHRRNFLEYDKPGGGKITMQSQHWQLGLGARI